MIPNIAYFLSPCNCWHSGWDHGVRSKVRCQAAQVPLLGALEVLALMGSIMLRRNDVSVCFPVTTPCRCRWIVSDGRYTELIAIYTWSLKTSTSTMWTYLRGRRRLKSHSPLTLYWCMHAQTSCCIAPCSFTVLDFENVIQLVTLVPPSLKSHPPLTLDDLIYVTIMDNDHS